MAGLAARIVVAAVAGKGSEQWAVGTDSERPEPSDCWYCMGRWGPAGPRQGHDTGPSYCAIVCTEEELGLGRSFEVMSGVGRRLWSRGSTTIVVMRYCVE